MKYLILIFLLPLHAFAQSPLNVTIEKKSARGQLLLTAVDEGEAKHPLRLIVRVKCGPDAKWKVVDPQHRELPANVCFVTPERAGDWNEGLQTLKFSFFVRAETKSAEYGACSEKTEAEIDLRAVCGN